MPRCPFFLPNLTDSDFSSCNLCNTEPFTAGGNVQGNVIVNSGRVINKGELIVHLYGKEKVAIPPRTGSNNSSSTSRDERQVISSRQVLRDFSKLPCKASGVGKYPFSISLPPSLPASMSVGTKDNGVRIQYKLKATLHSHSKDLYLFIQSAPIASYPPIPSEIGTMEVPIPSGGGWNWLKKVVGLSATPPSVTVGAQLANSVAAKGQVLDLHLACHETVSPSFFSPNKGSVSALPQVEIRLVECIRWTAGSHEQRDAKTLGCVPAIDLPESCVRRRPADRNENNHLQSTVIRALTESFESSNTCHTVTLHVPLQARDTYQGQICQVWHLLEIRPSLSTSTRNGTGPCRTLPVRVGSPGPIPASMATHDINNISMSPSIPVPHPQFVSSLQSEETIPMASVVSVSSSSMLVGVHEEQLRQPQVVAETPVIVLGSEAFDVAYVADSVPEINTNQEPTLTEDITPLSSLTPLAPPSVEDMASTTESGASNPTDLPIEMALPPAPTGLPQQRPNAAAVSLSGLLQDMESSACDYNLLRARMRRREWQPFFETLEPSQFAQIVAKVRHVDPETVAGEMAVLVRPGFRCAHAAAALRSVGNDHRRSLAVRLIPLCSDIVEPHSYGLILRQLKRSDQAAIRSDLDAAIAAMQRRQSNQAQARLQQPIPAHS